jgi:hypothetical protein
MNAAILLVFLGKVENKNVENLENDPPKSEIW